MQQDVLIKIIFVFLSQIAETYAFLPREAVTRFLMGCGECQKRMHISPSGAECKGTTRKSSLRHHTNVWR